MAESDFPLVTKSGEGKLKLPPQKKNSSKHGVFSYPVTISVFLAGVGHIPAIVRSTVLVLARERFVCPTVGVSVLPAVRAGTCKAWSGARDGGSGGLLARAEAAGFRVGLAQGG